MGSNTFRRSTTGTGEIFGLAQGQSQQLLEFLASAQEQVQERLGENTARQAQQQGRVARDALTSSTPVFEKLEGQILEDLSTGGNRGFENALRGQIRNAQASRGVFGSPFSAITETTEIAQLRAAQRQQSQQNASNFIALSQVGLQGPLVGNSLAPGFGQLLNLFQGQQNAKLEEFGFRSALQSANARDNASLLLGGIGATVDLGVGIFGGKKKK